MKNITLAHSVPRACLGLVALTLAACSGGEPQIVIPKPAAPILKVEETTKSTEEREATLARLARQEAAARMTEKLGAPAPRAPEPAPRAPEPAARAPEPAPRKAEPAARPQQPAPRAVEAAPRAIPVKATPITDTPSREALAIVPPAGFVEAPRPAPVKAEAPKAEPPVQLAAAAPVRAAAPTRVLSRVEPDFPRAAFQARVDRGVVKARLTLDGVGNVTRVDIVEAQPRRVFDNAVMAALTQWKFNDGATGRTYETEVVFQR